MSEVDIDDSKLQIDDSKLQIGDSKCATVACECEIAVTQRHPGDATLKSNHSKSQERGVASWRGSKVRVALVTGDDIMGRLDELTEDGHELRNMETGEPLHPSIRPPNTRNESTDTAPRNTT